MEPSTPKNFRWRLLPFGRRRLAWTSFARRQARIVAASDAARLFHPLSPEQPYWRRKPHIEKAPPEFFRGIDHLCSTPASPPPGGMATFDEICAVGGGVLLTRDGDVVAESLSNSEDVQQFNPFSRQGGDLTIRIWPLTPIRFLPGDTIYLRQFWDGN